MNPYEIIDAWHERVHAAVADALAYLATLDARAISDGVLGDWIDVLVAMRFTADDVPVIASILDKPDPLLQEAGVRLARAALRTVDAADAFEPPLARLVAHPIDGWVLEALIDLLWDQRQHALTTVYRGLAAIHGMPFRRPGILRNRGIQPWRRLVEHYQQLAIQTAEPFERDLAYLPVLERELGTRGWEATQRKVLTTMGFDPEQHLRLLRGV